MNPYAVVLGIGGVIACIGWLMREKLPRAFISFAVEDARMRDLFVGQAKHKKVPWKFEDASIHEPFSERWKTQARERIKRSGVVIQLVGENTYRADGAIWEVKCARDEGIPTFGVWISKDGKHKVPSCFARDDVIAWSWDGVQGRLANAVKARSGSK
jgi:hypothetical protein